MTVLSHSASRFPSIPFIVSQVIFAVAFLLALLSFFPFPEGICFLGRYTATTTELKSTDMSAKHWYDVHGKYRGVFFRDGAFALGTLVADTQFGTQNLWQPTTGLQLIGGVAFLPVYPQIPSWNIFGLAAGRVHYGNPAPPDSWDSTRLRFNFGLVALVEAYILFRHFAPFRRRRDARKSPARPACNL